MVSSAAALATVVPSGDKVRHKTRAVCPVRIRISLFKFLTYIIHMYLMIEFLNIRTCAGKPVSIKQNKLETVPSDFD